MENNDIHSREREEEESHLREVVTFIDSEISRKQSRLPATAAYQATADQIQMLTEVTLDQLRAARHSPYFGRVDFRRGQEPEPMVYYIGKHLAHPEVFSWTAPMAALFYNPAAGGYEAPRGFVSGQVELKRQCDIKETRLNSFVDVLRLPTAARLGALGPGTDESA